MCIAMAVVREMEYSKSQTEAMVQGRLPITSQAVIDMMNITFAKP